MTDAIVVLITAPSADVAVRIARAVVEEKLAACVSIVSGVRSIYRWKGKIEDDAENLMLAKTTPALFASLRDRVIALHPYEVPEIMALDVSLASEKYLGWLFCEVG